MKTTENISLAGYAFTIESDAYSELDAYLTDIHEAFATDASAEEITADIEARIAELLKEKYIPGMAVSLEMVNEIKKRIGDPKMLAADEPEVSETPSDDKEARKQHNSLKNRHLYRNLEEKVLGGVCAGLGNYFGIDRVLFRILFLLFFFIGFLGIDDGPYFGFSLLAYICLWIAMPAARTAEQKREMKGKPTNLDSYRSKDFDFGTEVREAAQSPAGRTIKRAGGVFLGILLFIIGLGGMLGCALIPSIEHIIGYEIADEIADFGPLDAEEMFIADLLTGNSTLWIMIMVITGLMFIWFIYNGIMLLFDLKAPSWRPGLILFIAWVISIFIIFAYILKMTVEAFPSLIINNI